MRRLTVLGALCLVLAAGGHSPPARSAAAEPASAAGSAAVAVHPGTRAATRRPGRKNVLAWIDSRSLMQSHGAAVIERLGYESGLYDTYIRSNAEAAIAPGSAGQRSELFDLDKFDAIFFLGSIERDLTPQQRAELIAFVKDDGKGFVGGHAASDAFQPWDEFAELLGGRLDGHPWGKTDLTFVIENPGFPGLQRLPRILTRFEESYEIRALSRDKVDVLMRLDATGMDMSKPHRKDGDYPVAWAKLYGKGRVYNNILGHEIEVWDNPAIQTMYFEALKWALGLTDVKLEPHPLRQVRGTPAPLQ